jgi:hypothetical protein
VFQILRSKKYHFKASVKALRILTVIQHTPTSELVRQADNIAKLDATARNALALEEHEPVVVINVGLL